MEVVKNFTSKYNEDMVEEVCVKLRCFLDTPDYSLEILDIKKYSQGRFQGFKVQRGLYFLDFSKLVNFRSISLRSKF